MFSSFFFNDTATTEIYTLSLHDALPIFFERTARLFPLLHGLIGTPQGREKVQEVDRRRKSPRQRKGVLDRKSTRLNSSHSQISYAVFCLKKKKRFNTRRNPLPHVE